MYYVVINSLDSAETSITLVVHEYTYSRSMHTFLAVEAGVSDYRLEHAVVPCECFVDNTNV